MTGIYFSGTGNTKYCVERFMREIDPETAVCSIEADETPQRIAEDDYIVFGYPVQYSNIPKIVKDFVVSNSAIWSGKQVFVIATMGLFSGDGAGMLGRLLSKYGAEITGGLHLKMPDCIGDEKALKRPLEENRRLVAEAGAKIGRAVMNFKDGHPTREGLGFAYHLAGLFGQRLYFYNKTRYYSDKLKIDAGKCVGCGTCEKLCPMGNIRLEGKLAVPGDRCTMCYRCVSRCPAQAITLLGKQIIEQCYIEKYL